MGDTNAPGRSTSAPARHRGTGAGGGALAVLAAGRPADVAEARCALPLAHPPARREARTAARAPRKDRMIAPFGNPRPFCAASVTPEDATALWNEGPPGQIS